MSDSTERKLHADKKNESKTTPPTFITLTLPIAPWEAALGATVQTPTLGGPVELRIPPNAKAGQMLRLKGRGLPGATPGTSI